DRFSYKELQHVESLGLAKKGEAGKRVVRGDYGPEGRLPVNVSGGSLGCGNVFEATGLHRAAEVALQLRGAAGVRQLEGCRADVDMVVCGTAPDAFDGVAMKGEYLLDGSGGYRKPYTRVFTGGGTGVFSTIAGWWHVASGLADVVLVVNEEKMSSCQPHPQS